MNLNQPKTMRSFMLANPVFCLRLLESQFYAKPLTTELAGSINVKPKSLAPREIHYIRNSVQT